MYWVYYDGNEMGMRLTPKVYSAAVYIMWQKHEKFSVLCFETEQDAREEFGRLITEGRLIVGIFNRRGKSIRCHIEELFGEIAFIWKVR